MMDPFFTVIIPTYNRAGYIGRAVDCVLGQTFEALELIVVDDGSTDGTSALMESYEDDRLHYIETVHMGVNIARNIGLALARAEWVAFLDSDDLWDEDRLNAIHKRIKGENEAKVYVTDFRRLDSEESRFPKEYINNAMLGQYLLSFGSLGGMSNLVAPKKWLLESGGMDIELSSAQDTDVYYKLTEKYPLYYLPGVYAIHDLESNNRISSNAELKLNGIIKFFFKYKSRMTLLSMVLGRKKIFDFALRFGKWKEIILNFPFALAVKILKGIHGVRDDFQLLLQPGRILRWMRQR